MSGQHKLTLFIIILLGLLIRALLITYDPFLYSWDERFHAQVAKNMLTNPFRPTLRMDPIKPFDYTQWCCNTIWLHKPPLFLWKMAMSIKIFGANEWAIRIPSLVMSAGIIFSTFKIGKILDGPKTGLLAALFICLSRYQIERSIGNISTDHNDTAFLFYMTLGLYFLTKYYLQSSQKSLILFGITVGLAALVKGPQAISLFLLLGLIKVGQFFNKEKLHIWDIGKAFFIYLLISLPWTIYTAITYPKESTFERSYNFEHIWSVAENHGGSIWWHFDYFDHLYGPLNIIFLVVGSVFFLKTTSLKKLPILLLIYVGLIYFFYSFIVKTKMPGYVFILCPIIYILMAFGVKSIFQFLTKTFSKTAFRKRLLYLLTIFLAGIFIWNNLRPHEMYQFHVHDQTTKYYSWDGRSKKKQNSIVYKKLDDLLPEDCVVFNTPPYEDIEVMFYSGRNAYQYLEEELYNELKRTGTPIAYFKNVSNQPLLPWVVGDEDIIWIEDRLDY